MDEKSITQLIEEAIYREEVSLPIFNQVALRMQQLLTRGDYSMDDVSRVISRDQGLASDVLKMANAAFYSGIRPVKTIQDATVRLGAKTIYNLVTAVTQRQLYRSHKKEFDPWMKPLWSHALAVAFASRWLALHLGKHQLMEECFMAGLFHDIGKLYILKAIEDLQKANSIKNNSSKDLIGEILKKRHADHGQRLMERMNMPEIYCQVAGMHHDANFTAQNTVLILVRLGNLACHKAGIGFTHKPDSNLVKTQEAVSLLATELLLDELQAKLEEYAEWVTRFFT